MSTLFLKKFQKKFKLHFLNKKAPFLGLFSRLLLNFFKFEAL